MEIALYHGPTRRPLRLDAGAPASPPRPYHGIMPRGLLEMHAAGRLSAEAWHRWAHVLGEILDDDDALAVQRLAREAGVLSFTQSALAAQAYLEVSQTEGCTVEAWNVKEGHTSSVWTVTIRDERTAVRDRFVLNVARDKAAAIELERTSELMRAITERNPGINMAQVYDIRRVRIEHRGETVEVLVTRVEWIAGDEVHVLSRGGKDVYVAVESFVVAEHSAEIAALRGRPLDGAAHAKLEQDVRACLRRAAVQAQIDIEVNEGDVVWDGTTGTVVAVN